MLHGITLPLHQELILGVARPLDTMCQDSLYHIFLLAIYDERRRRWLHLTVATVVLEQ